MIESPREFSFLDSRELLQKFQILESSYGSDWYDAEDENATYIWLIEDIENPLGFLSYKTLIHPNKIDFIYIVKIYVLERYRGKNPILIEDERVSEILFRQVDSKGIDILTLESACEKLDIRYKQLGFEYNQEISEIFGSAISTSGQIMYRRKKGIEMSDEMKEVFGI